MAERKARATTRARATEEADPCGMTKEKQGQQQRQLLSQLPLRAWLEWARYVVICRW
jgi:hypothetical protein